MAPWVSSGHKENAMFAAVIISWMAMPTSHGKPPPPYSVGNGTAGQPGLDVTLRCLAEPVRRGHRAVVVAAAVPHVADAVERGELLLEEPRRFLEDPCTVSGSACS